MEMEGESITEGNETAESMLANIPQHVLKYSILHLLSTDTLSRFRSVSKEWNLLLTSSCRVMNHGFFVGRPKPHERHWYYSSLCKKWMHISLSFPYISLRSMFEYSGSNSGLLLLLERNKSFKDNLWICNPLAKTSRKLPALMVENLCLHGILSLEKNAYKVVAIGYSSEKKNTVHIYDSCAKNWTVARHLPETTLIQSAIVFCKDFFFFKIGFPKNSMGFISIQDCSSFSLVGIPIHGERQTPHGNKYWVWYELAVWRSSVFVAVAEEREMVVWEFVAKDSWKEIARMPSSLYSFSESEFKLIVAGDCLYFKNGYGLGEDRIIEYDLLRRTWNILPECPVPWDGRGPPIPFQPRPDMDL